MSNWFPIPEDETLTKLFVLCATGILSPSSVSIALGITEAEWLLISTKRLEPTGVQERKIEQLVTDYVTAMKRINADWTQARIKSLPRADFD